MGNCNESESDCCSGDSCCDHEKPSMSKKFMYLSHDAWAELMKDKLKEAFEKTEGKKMDNAAEVCVEFSTVFWKAKKEGKKPSKEEFEAFSKKLMEALQG